MAIETTFGEEIGMSRKDIRRQFDNGVITFNEMNKADIELAKKFLTKDKIWPEPDWKQYNGSFSSYFVKLLRDFLPLTIPKDMFISDITIDIERYFIMMQSFKEKAELFMEEHPAEKDDFTQIVSLLRERPFKEEIIAFGRRSLNAYFKNFAHPVNIALNFNHSSWPLFPKSLFVDPTTSIIRSDVNDFKLVQSRKYLLDAHNTIRSFKTEQEAIDFGNTYSPEKKTHKTRLEMPTRPMHHGIERIGPNYDFGKIDPEFLMKKFGLRGGEFGEWLTNDDRQECLNFAANAFMDMSLIFDIPPEQIGQGVLAIALGSRGTGSAMAHYEPLRKVFNLTKTKGAGCLAHEYGHFLDDMAKEQHRYYSKNLGCLTQKHIGQDQDAILLDPRWNNFRRNLSSWMKEFPQEQSFIRNAHPTSTEFVQALEVGYKCILSSKNNQPLKNRKNVEAFSRSYQRCIETPPIFIETDFIKNARLVDKRRSSPYWGTEVELFARAFECLVDQKLQKKEIINPYLVDLMEFEIPLYPDPTELALMEHPLLAVANFPISDIVIKEKIKNFSPRT